MKLEIFNQALCDFIDGSPTPFHATQNIASRLTNNGFKKLHEPEDWQLKSGQGYFVTRNDSAIIGFRMADNHSSSGIRMIGAHTDSPCLKLKPNGAQKAHGYWQFGVEVYGGVLLNPWFDRDLSLAGRVTVKTGQDQLANHLINFEQPLAIIPSLAIHLDREANQERSINAQTYLPAIIATESIKFDLKKLLLSQLRLGSSKAKKIEVIDFELMLYPSEKSAFVGLDKEFIASARLDNLLSCFVATQTLIDSTKKTNQLIVCNDHEEVGSGSTSGARGSFLKDVLTRITGDDQQRLQMFANSMLISTDNAHGIHPNFADKHDKQHGPLLNKGPAIKVNSNQSYATNSETAAYIKVAAEKAKVAVQSFVTRSDLGCGSTIGPITATQLGIRTADVGVPTFAMHSIRELAGRDDAFGLYQTLKQFCAFKRLSVA